MEYNIILSVKIISYDKQTWTFGRRELKLPFVPNIGIILLFDDSISQPIKTITYSMKENIFYCNTIHEIQYEDEDLEFWVKKYRNKGWAKLDDLFVSYIEGGIEAKEGFFKDI